MMIMRRGDVKSVDAGSSKARRWSGSGNAWCVVRGGEEGQEFGRKETLSNSTGFVTPAMDLPVMSPVIACNVNEVRSIAIK